MGDVDLLCEFREQLPSRLVDLEPSDATQLLRAMRRVCPTAVDVARARSGFIVSPDCLTDSMWQELWSVACAPRAASCGQCGDALPTLWDAMRHQCNRALERCTFPCRTTLPAPAMAAHRAKCPCTIVECRWCHKRYRRDFCATHEASCPQRRTTCERCHGTFVGSQAAHDSVCAAIEVACKFCALRLPRLDAVAHAAVCPERAVTCTWCAVTLPARLLEMHSDACAQRTVECPTCHLAIPQGEDGEGMKRHHVDEHAMPAMVERMRCARRCGADAPCSEECRRAGVDMEHALWHSFRCGERQDDGRDCIVCSRHEYTMQHHIETAGCTAACDHPLCAQQARRCCWPGCDVTTTLLDVAEHERICAHRVSTCTYCLAGPLDLESMRHHTRPPFRCDAVAQRCRDMEREEEDQVGDLVKQDRAHARACQNAADSCSRCGIWRGVCAVPGDTRRRAKTQRVR